MYARRRCMSAGSVGQYVGVVNVAVTKICNGKLRNVMYCNFPQRALRDAIAIIRLDRDFGAYLYVIGDVRGGLPVA
jgi:hypothetical protein